MIHFATYKCPDCGEERRLPESPTTGPRYVKVLCNGFCQRYKTHLRRDVWAVRQGAGVASR